MDKKDFYKLLIVVDDMTTNNLLNIGFNKYYISRMVKEKVIKRISKGKYEFYNYNELYSYGKKLIKSEQFDDAIKCFIKCINYDKTDIKAYFQLIIVNIYKKNYDEVLKYLDTLSGLGVIVENERRYLLYLISCVATLDENYIRELEHLTFDFIKYDKYSDRNAYNENRIRGFCYKKKFSLALANNRKMFKGKYTSNFAIVHDLLMVNAYEKIKNDAKVMGELIQEKNYLKVKEMLDTEINPSMYNIYVGKLLDELIRIESTNQLSKTNLIEASNVFEAIDGKNYSLALSLSNSDDEYNLINLLLKNICKKIKDIVNPVQDKQNKVNLNYFTEINKDNYYEVEKFINYIYKVLSKKQGVYIMDEFNETATNDLLQILELYPDFRTFLIDYNLEKRIVVRYCPVKKEDINLKSSYDQASWLYEYGQYNECLDICLKLLQENQLETKYYILTAFTYLKLKKVKDARNYLMIIYHLTKEQKYADIIATIDGAYSKQIFEMNEDEFYDSLSKRKIK